MRDETGREDQSLQRVLRRGYNKFGGHGTGEHGYGPANEESTSGTTRDITQRKWDLLFRVLFLPIENPYFLVMPRFKDRTAMMDHGTGRRSVSALTQKPQKSTLAAQASPDSHVISGGVLLEHNAVAGNRA